MKSKIFIPILVSTLLSIAVHLGTAGPAVSVGASTSHGGNVTTGSANVMVGGQPMGKIGSNQSCPLTNHVGGPITTGSPTVFVNGVPAAINGSSANCVGSSTVINGNSTTVFVQ